MTGNFLHYTTISFMCMTVKKNIFAGPPRERSVDKILSAHGQCTAMNAGSEASNLPDRQCTWCNVPMKKRLVASGQFIHYTCPKCIFQHTTRRGPKPPAPEKKH